MEAVAGHATLGLDEATPNNRFAAAVTQTRAQGLILVRLLGVDTRTQVRTTMAPGGMGEDTIPGDATRGAGDGRLRRPDPRGAARARHHRAQVGMAAAYQPSGNCTPSDCATFRMSPSVWSLSGMPSRP